MQFREAFDISHAIEAGWGAIQRNPAGMLVGGVMVGLADSCSRAGSGTGSGSDDAPPDLAALLAAIDLVFIVVGLAVAMVATVVWCLLYPGWLRMHRAIAEDTPSDLSILVSVDRFLPLLGWVILKGVIMLIALGGGALPGALVGVVLYQITEPWIALVAFLVLWLLVTVPFVAWLAAGMALTERAIVYDGMGPVDALGRSWELTAGQRVWVIFYAFVLGIVRSMGLLACCVGVFVTGAAMDYAWSESYLALTTGQRKPVMT